MTQEITIKHVFISDDGYGAFFQALHGQYYWLKTKVFYMLYCK